MLSQHSLSRLRLLVDGINGSLVRKRKTVYCPPARNETIAQMECSLSAMKKKSFSRTFETLNHSKNGQIGNVAEAATSNGGEFSHFPA